MEIQTKKANDKIENKLQHLIGNLVNSASEQKVSLVLLCCNLIGSKQFVISSNATEKKKDYQTGFNFGIVFCNNVSKQSLFSLSC